MRDYSYLLHELDKLSASEANDSLCALLVIHIPRLDDVNLEYGYQTGNQFLSAITDNITRLLREQDSLAKISAQEYSVLLRNLTNPGQAVMAAQKLYDIANRDLMVNNHALKMKFNIGISYYPHHSTKSYELIQQAGIAARMAFKKKIGYCVYSERDIPFDSNLALEKSLEDAIDNAEIRAYYQPIIDLRSGNIISFESLARWNNDQYGFLPAATFVELAEKSDLIRNFTILTLNTTMREYSTLAKYFPDAKVSVNLSALLLNDEDIIALVKRAMNIWNMPPEALMLEVTESAIMADRDRSSGILDSFNQLGISIAIDDFGMGQASLKYIKYLPISDIKVDRAFVHKMHIDKDDRKIVKGIVDLAHSLDLSVIAEGIEDEKCIELLRDMGCEYGQGFYFARPMPVEALADFLGTVRQEN